MSSPAAPAALSAKASEQAGGGSVQGECPTAWLQRRVIMSSAHPGAHGEITKKMTTASLRYSERRSIFLLKRKRLSRPNVTDKSSLNNSLRQINSFNTPNLHYVSAFCKLDFDGIFIRAPKGQSCIYLIVQRKTGNFLKSI